MSCVYRGTRKYYGYHYAHGQGNGHGKQYPFYATSVGARVANSQINDRRILFTMILTAYGLSYTRPLKNPLKVCRYIINNIDWHSNKMIATNESIRKAVRLSVATVARVMGRLSKAKMIIRHTGYISLNSRLLKPSRSIVIDFVPRHVNTDNPKK